MLEISALFSETAVVKLRFQPFAARTAQVRCWQQDHVTGDFATAKF